MLGLPALSDVLENFTFIKGAPVAIPPVTNCSQNELSVWLHGWFAEAGDEEKAMMVQGLYGLWLARNEARDSRKIADPRVVAESVWAYMEEWKKVHERGPFSSPRRSWFSDGARRR